MNADIADLAAQKRELLRKGDRYRETLRAELDQVSAAIEFVPRVLSGLRVASTLLLMLAPVAFVASRRGVGRVASGGIFKRLAGLSGKVLTAVRLYQRVRPFLGVLLKPRA